MSSSSSSSSSTTLGGLPSMNAASLHQYLPQPKPARSFGDRVSFETGVSYFAGLVGGGSFGLFAGVREARRQQFTGKLFMNQVSSGGGQHTTVDSKRSGTANFRTSGAHTALTQRKPARTKCD